MAAGESAASSPKGRRTKKPSSLHLETSAGFLLRGLFLAFLVLATAAPIDGDSKLLDSIVSGARAPLDPPILLEKGDGDGAISTVTPLRQSQAFGTPAVLWFERATTAPMYNHPMHVVADKNGSVYSIGRYLAEDRVGEGVILRPTENPKLGMLPEFWTSRDAARTFTRKPMPYDIARWRAGTILFDSMPPASLSSSCRLICVIGGAENMTWVPTSRVDCTSDAGDTWSQHAPLPTTILDPSLVVYNGSILLAGGSRGDASEGFLEANVSASTCRIEGWGLLPGVNPATGRLSVTIGAVRTNPEFDAPEMLFVGAGSNDGPFSVVMSDMWMSYNPRNASQWDLFTRQVAIDPSDSAILDEPILFMGDMRDTDGLSWTIGIGPGPSIDSDPNLDFVATLVTIDRLFQSATELGAWANLQALAMPNPDSADMRDTFPASLRRVVVTTDPLHGGVPVILGFAISNGKVWRGDVAPCITRCPPYHRTTGCQEDAFDAQCIPCSTCEAGTYASSTCLDYWSGAFYGDTVCSPCNVCKEEEIEVSPCNGTQKAVCVLRAVPRPRQPGDPLEIDVHVQTLSIVFGAVGAAAFLACIGVILSEAFALRRLAKAAAANSASSASASCSSSSFSTAVEGVPSLREMLPRALVIAWPIAGTIAGSSCHLMVLLLAWWAPDLRSTLVTFLFLCILALLGSFSTLAIVATRSEWFNGSRYAVGRTAFLALCGILHPRVFLLPPLQHQTFVLAWARPQEGEAECGGVGTLNSKTNSNSNSNKQKGVSLSSSSGGIISGGVSVEQQARGTGVAVLPRSPSSSSSPAASPSAAITSPSNVHRQNQQQQQQQQLKIVGSAGLRAFLIRNRASAPSSSSTSDPSATAIAAVGTAATSPASASPSALQMGPASVLSGPAATASSAPASSSFSSSSSSSHFPFSSSFAGALGVRRGMLVAVFLTTLVVDIPALLISVFVMGKQLPGPALVALAFSAAHGLFNVTATMVAAGNRIGRLAVAAKLTSSSRNDPSSSHHLQNQSAKGVGLSWDADGMEGSGVGNGNSSGNNNGSGGGSGFINGHGLGMALGFNNPDSSSGDFMPSRAGLRAQANSQQHHQQYSQAAAVVVAAAGDRADLVTAVLSPRTPPSNNPPSPPLPAAFAAAASSSSSSSTSTPASITSLPPPSAVAAAALIGVPPHMHAAGPADFVVARHRQMQQAQLQHAALAAAGGGSWVPVPPPATALLPGQQLAPNPFPQLPLRAVPPPSPLSRIALAPLPHTSTAPVPLLPAIVALQHQHHQGSSAASQATSSPAMSVSGASSSYHPRRPPPRPPQHPIQPPSTAAVASSAASLSASPPPSSSLRAGSLQAMFGVDNRQFEDRLQTVFVDIAATSETAAAAAAAAASAAAAGANAPAAPPSPREDITATNPVADVASSASASSDGDQSAYGDEVEDDDEEEEEGAEVRHLVSGQVMSASSSANAAGFAHGSHHRIVPAAAPSDSSSSASIADGCADQDPLGRGL